MYFLFGQESLSTYPGSDRVARHHDNRAHWTVFGQQTSRVAAVGPSLASNHLVKDVSSLHTHLVVKTKMAPAFNSRLALTADMAMASTVLAGRGHRLRNSSKMLK